MRVYISVDMEGITGVVHTTQTVPGERDYERFRRIMTREANAAVEGAIDGGATDILVNDSHGPMTNLLIEDLHPAARLISGRTKPLSMMQGIEQGWDAAFFIGYHSRHGTTASVLDHTWSSATIVHAELNGRPVCEGDLNAGLAGEFGVPVVLVTGDETYCRQQQELLGEDLACVAVKISLGRFAAESLSLAESHRRIRETAARALATKREPYRFPPPHRLVLTYNHAGRADLAAQLPGSERVDGLRVAYETNDYQQMMQARSAMLTLGAG
ncbi:MAG: M55 family metallopeptidase [Chloroflexi bacterium]|nr:M55 family metallopeptidase [Chloroflexota bacterium]